MGFAGAIRPRQHHDDAVTRRLRLITRVAALASAITLAATALAPRTALAHALLVKSEPAQRSVLSTAPAEVRLWFNERIEPAFSSATVMDAANNPVTTQPAEVSRDDPKLLRVPVPPLPPGAYIVRYRVLSVDGHTVQASFRFTVRGRPASR